jgi:hypothetical protein
MVQLVRPAAQAAAAVVLLAVQPPAAQAILLAHHHHRETKAATQSLLILKVRLAVAEAHLPRRLILPSAVQVRPGALVLHPQLPVRPQLALAAVVVMEILIPVRLDLAAAVRRLTMQTQQMAQ